MAKRLQAVSFGPMTGGINRFVKEAADDQCTDALNVWERDGDLQRRPAFWPIGTNAPYFLPAGTVYVTVQDIDLATYTNYTTRAPTVTTNIGGTQFRLWVGCLLPFDGIEWARITSQPADTAASANRFMKPMYWNGSALVPIYGAHDTTKRSLTQSTGPTENLTQPLRKNGRISWDQSKLTGWGLYTLPGHAIFGGITDRYWVALDCSIRPMLAQLTTQTPVSAALSSGGDIVTSARGIRCFLLNPVNGLMPAVTRGNAKVVVTGSCFPQKRGNVLGGGLGYLRSELAQTEIARIVEDEGSGAAGQVAAATWAGGTWNDGTANQITKHRVDYEWIPNNASGIDVGQFDGAPVINVTADVGSTTRVMALPNNWFGPHNSNFENHRIRCISGVGTPVGEEREIYRSGATTIEVYDVFTVAPAAAQVFEIRKPPSFVRTREGTTDYEVGSNTAHALVPIYVRQYTNSVATADTNSYVNFEIFKECFWALNPGQRWCAAFDSVTGKLILTNGENGLLEFDGLRTRRLQALWDSTEGAPGAAVVQLWRGILQDQATQKSDPNLLNGSDLRHSPPNGKYVVDFSGRLVVAHIRERSQSVIWSAPGGLNNLWPLVYETLVRDSDNGPITGMTTLSNRLIVFTKTCIFAGEQPNERGEIFFQPLSNGAGFTSNAAVARIAIGGRDVLIGPSVDGIRIFDGSGTTEVLDDWRRIFKNGVNKGKLEKAVGAALTTENLYFLSIEESGGNNRLIVVDYARAPKAQIWVWSTPSPITAIARRVLSNGAEQILFGHENGHVTTLVENDVDCWGDVIDAHAKTKPVNLGDVERAAFSKLLVSLKPLGSSAAGNSNNTMTVEAFLNRNEALSADADFGAAGLSNMGVYGTSSYNSSAVYTPPSLRTFPINLPSGAYGEQIAIKISGRGRWRYGGAEVIIIPKGQKSQNG